MSVPEISRDVALGQYSTIDWASFGRTGILSPEDVSVLKAADAPLDYSLGDAGTKAFVASLLKVVRGATTSARQYALTRVEDILLAEDCGTLMDRAALFADHATGALDAAPLMRAWSTATTRRPRGPFNFPST